jgi:iron complex transport system substrate-binding protein
MKSSFKLTLSIALILCLAGVALFAGEKNNISSEIKENSCVIQETDDSLIALDADGKKVKLTKNPKRTIICYTSLVGLWHYVGGSVIGIPSSRGKDRAPEELRKTERIGTFSSLNLEKIISMKPDLVLLYAHVKSQRAAQDILRANKTETILLDYRNYDDFLKILDLFARLNDKGKKVKTLAFPVLSEINATIKKASKLKGPRFLSLMLTGKGVNAETNYANTARMATLLGGKNIVPEKGIPESMSRVKFSLEKIMMEDPDVILITTMGDFDKLTSKMKDKFVKDPVWASLRAVKTNHVYFLPSDLFLYRANEKYSDAFRILAQAMYPEENWK